MKVEVGKYIYADKKIMPKEYLINNPSVRGHMYEIVIKLKNKVNPEQAKYIIKTLPAEMWKRFGAKTKYIGINDDLITMQIEGSPFDWGDVLLFLPQILEAVGLIVTIISVLLIARSATWQLALLAIGLFTLYEGLKMQGAEKEAIRKVTKTVEKVIE